MGKRLTTEEFIERAKAVHGDKYDYSRTKYIDCHTNVCIICSKHGEFWQNPTNHYRKRYGCPTCGHGISRQSWFLNTNTFISQAKLVHGNKYDYSETNYVSYNKDVVIICPKHGRFTQIPNVHLRGCGCPRCAGKNVTTEQFIAKARLVHGDKYDYSPTKYKVGHAPVAIICPIHGVFHKSPTNHLKGQGCPKCSKEAQNSPIYGIGINDSKKGYNRKARKTWFCMMKRCYSPKYTLEHPTYRNCVVCKDWLTYSNFEEWYLSQPNHSKDGYELDKDLLSGSSKIYSPDTCCLLPKKINTMISTPSQTREGLPCGVYQRDNGSCFIVYGGKQTFPSIEEAHKEYLHRRYNAIVCKANDLLLSNKIDERIYNALINFKFI